MLKYASMHANHVHQLSVCASKHYYLTNDGRLKYQDKPMEVRLSNIMHGRHVHLVLYLVRDHFSGLFYAEVAGSDRLVPVEQFLYRAWSRKNDYVFCGVPDMLMIPRTVSDAFPSATKSVAELGVRLLDVTSGFQSGVCDTRTVETYLLLAQDQTMEVAARRTAQIARDAGEQKSRNGVDSKSSYWRSNVTSITYPPESWRSSDDILPNSARPLPTPGH
jgi:hypothetical protein